MVGLVFCTTEAKMIVPYFAVLLILLSSSEGIKYYLDSEIRSCLNCLCHARTGCYSRYNCASYSISYEYWKTANSPVVSDTDNDTEESYKKCMRNEHCILATLAQYADAIGHMDCNCDGKFDCKDRFAIHLYGENCTNPKFSSRYVKRFNTCARDIGVQNMLEEEGFEGCEPSAENKRRTGI